MRASTSWLLILTLLALGMVSGLMLTGGERSPRELVDSARQRVVDPEPDMQQALEELDLAFKLSLQEGSGVERELVADILVMRGTLLRSLGSEASARTDLQAVLDTWRPGDVDVELMLIDLDVRDQDHDAALDRVDALLKREGDKLEAWTMRGTILIRLAGKRVAEAALIARSNMGEEPAQRAADLLERASGMHLRDPLRVAVLHELHSLFESSEESEARAVLKLADQASQDIAEARVALVQSFRGKLSAEALLAYVRILKNSGHPQDAIDFGQAVSIQPAANGSREIMQEILQSLMEVGRPEQGADLVDRRFQENLIPNQEFFESWCRALYAAQRWKQLTYIAGQMRNYSDEDGQSIAGFYLGVSQANDGHYSQASQALQRYLQKDAIEPFKGGLPIAWRALALSARQQGELFNEKPALLEAVKLDPDGSGEDWLRLATLYAQTEPEALDKIEHALAQAIRLLPKRRDEILPRWAEAGETRLSAYGIVLELLWEELSAQGRSTPLGASGSFELFRLAELHRDHGSYVQAQSTCRRLLEDYPGFLPAIDLQAEVAAKSAGGEEAAELWLQHLEVTGAENTILRRLGKLPKDTFDHSQLLRLMRIDPERTGRLLVAQTLRSDNRSLDALVGLTALDTTPLGDEGRLIMGQLYSDLGRWRQALESLMDIPAASPQFAEALPLSIEAALRTRDAEKLRALVAGAAQVPDLDPDQLVHGADLLMVGGFISEADELCRTADAQQTSRNGALVLRRAQIAWLADRRSEAQEHLERAAAFGDSGAVELGRLLMAIEDRAFAQLPFFVRDLLRTQVQVGRWPKATLTFFDERVDEAERLVASGRVEQPSEPLWSLLGLAIGLVRGSEGAALEPFGAENQFATLLALRGGGDDPRDPREFLGLVLAQQNQDWGAWATARLSQFDLDDPQGLWPNYLAARGYLTLGQAEKCEELLGSITERHPTFVPAWELNESSLFKRLGRFDDMRLFELRKRRRTALGAREGEEAEIHLVEAFELEAAGDLEGATKSMRRSLVEDPRYVPALTKLAELEARRGEWARAVQAHGQAVALAQVSSESPVVAGYLELLQSVSKVDPGLLPAPVMIEKLETVAKRQPRDPSVALALARADVGFAGRSPSIGVARAYERLARFRRLTQDTAIEALRPGATRAWKEFYLGLDPARAEEFVRAELELRPGSLELWLMLGETLAARGRPSEAIELFELCQRMVPDGDTRRAIANLLAEGGKPVELVEESIRQVETLERLRASDYELTFIRAQSFVNAGTGSRDAGIEILADLWARRAEAQGRFSAADVGQFYGTALVERARFGDRNLANQVLVDVQGLVGDDPARQNLLRALAHLALQIPSRTAAAR